MKYKLILLILLCWSKVNAQFFEFEPLNVDKVAGHTSSLKLNSNIIYDYFDLNYNIDSDKRNLKNLEYEPYSICKFQQEFSQGILYSIKECEEAKGTSIIIVLPIAKEKSVINWIEKVEKAETPNSTNTWNSDYTRFEPKETTPGCYYQIFSSEEKTTISIYCGC